MRSRGAWARLAIGGFTALILGLGTTPAHADSDYAYTVDTIVAQLKKDPILVQPILGSGDTALVHRRLETAATGQPVPVYVALVSQPHDVRTDKPSKELVVRLHARLGDGIFIAATNNDLLDVEAWGTGFPSVELSLARYDAIKEIHQLRDAPADTEQSIAAPGFEAQLILDLAKAPGLKLSDAALRKLSQQSLAFPSTIANYERDENVPTTGFKAMIAAFAGLLTLLVLLRGISWYGARDNEPRSISGSVRQPPAPVPVPEPGPTPAEIRELARTELSRLTAALSDASGTIVRPEALDDAQTAHQAAVKALAEQSGSADVGALVLARMGVRDHQRALGSADKPYVCCFVNPLHGEASTVMAVEANSQLRVPVCRSCSESPGLADPLILPRFGPDKPYFGYDDIWSRTGYGSIAPDFATQVLAGGAS